MKTGGRAGRPEHRGRHGPLHLRLTPPLLRLPRLHRCARTHPTLSEEFFLRDIEDGIAGTGVRPGVLKCATDKRGSLPESSAFCVRWRRSTGAPGIPISTHTHAPTHSGPRAAAGLRIRRGRSVASRDRSQRRHDRSRVPGRRCSRQDRHSAWTASGSTSTARRTGSGRDSRQAVRGGWAEPARALARRCVPRRLVRRGVAQGGLAQVELHAPHERRSSRGFANEG